jgi:NADH-quinone oxidoreductase subunit H
MIDVVSVYLISLKTKAKSQILSIKLKVVVFLFRASTFCELEKKKIDILLLLLILQTAHVFACFKHVVRYYFECVKQTRLLRDAERLCSRMAPFLVAYYDDLVKRVNSIWVSSLTEPVRTMFVNCKEEVYSHFKLLPTHLKNQIHSVNRAIIVLLNAQVILVLNLFEYLNRAITDVIGLVANFERLTAKLGRISAINKVILVLLNAQVILVLNLFEYLNRAITDVIGLVAQIFVVFISLLIAVAYFTIAERKIMGGIQRRKGPNVIGFSGLLQPLADGLKLFVKETILPANSNIGLFLLSPAWTFILSLIAWSIIPLAEGVLLSDLELGMVYLLAVSSLSVYGVLFAGWSSNSKYSYLGALRSAAQMISYELAIGFTFLTIIVCAGSLNLSELVLAQKYTWYVIPLLPTFIIFCVAMLAETNRHPFDLPEAEAELVSGYNVEYSSMTFALFFLGEYANMLQMSVLLSIFFLGGWLPLFTVVNIMPDVVWLFLKAGLGASFFIVTRAALPRYRYDQLMNVGWKCFLPLSIGYLIFVTGLLMGFNWLPKSF